MRTLSLLLALALPLAACTGDDTDTEDTDTGDTDTGDTGDTDVPLDCSPAPYQGDSAWTWGLSVPETITLCGTFDEGRTLEEELATKAKLHVPAGRYPLPEHGDENPIRIPVCVERPDGTFHVAGPLGNLVTNRWENSGTVSLSPVLHQPLENGGEFSFHGYAGHLEGERPEDLVLPPTAPDPFGGGTVWTRWCADTGEEYCAKDRGTMFFVCDPTSFELQTHTLTFEGGEIVLSIRMGQSAAGTEPAAFVEAAGTVDGTPFEQRDYWKLFYRPAHHHFSRNFGVHFDDPISGACGLTVRNLEPWSSGEGDGPELALVECELSPIETREVSDHVWDRE